MSSFDSKISISLENISISDKPSLLVAAINEILSMYFVDSRTITGRRGSFDGGYESGSFTDFDYMGNNFRFVNREAECKQLVTRFGKMDLLRGNRDFDQLKRDLFAPLCIGLSGLGKTRFARVAVTSLVRKATGVLSPTLVQMLQSSVTVAEEIWPDDRSHDKLLRELIFASHEDRNIRITLNFTPGAAVRNADVEIMVAVLVQWMKHRKLRPEFQHLIGCKIVGKLKGELGILREARFGRFTFCDVVKFIMEQSSRAAEVEDMPALIINLDEAQKIGSSLQNVLEILVSPIFMEECRVFVTVTGICTAAFRDAIVRSNVSLQPIILPVLTDEHMSSILANIFGVEENQLPLVVTNITKWLGGVPRFLEYFLGCVAKKARATTVEQIWEWLYNADNNSLMDIILMARSRVTGYALEVLEIPDDLLDNIFSITVAEHPIQLSDRLTREWTVEDAQNRSLLYWKGVPGGHGTVIMPPLLLHHIHLNSSKYAGASIHLLKRPSSTLTISDNESVAPTAFLHKLKAHSIAGREQVLLFKDLMGGMIIDGRDDILVTIPKCFNLEVLRYQIGVNEFSEKKSKVLADSEKRPSTTPIAFVNGRGAPFADAFVIFPELVIFIQEKQSVLARQQNATRSWIPKRQFPIDCVERELLKVSEAMKPDDLFLYVCDNQGGGAPCYIGTNTLLITVERHAVLLGSTLTWLRASSLEDSATRADAK